MRYLVLSDIHANIEALEAVLAAAGGQYGAVLSLGDLVGYGPNPNEVVTRIRELGPQLALVGNHDLAALGQLDLEMFNPYAREAAEWTAWCLASESRSYLSGIEPSAAGENVELFHASPRDPVWEYMEEGWQGRPNFAAFQAPLAFVGHTHVPRVFVLDESGGVTVGVPGAGETLQLEPGNRYIVNPGGVGQPRDGDPRAAYGIWDSEAATFNFERVPYDVPVTQGKIREAGLPEILAARLPLGH